MADTTKDDDKGKDGGKTRKSSYKLPDDAKGAEAAGDDAAAAGSDAGAEVIDLGEARTVEVNAGGGLLDNAVGDSLRASFRKFVVENVLPKDKKSGSVDLNIDANFLREHGTQLLSSLVEGVAKAILPEAVEMNLPLGKKAEGQKAAPAKAAESNGGASEGGDDPDVNVNVNFDAMTFLKSLLAPTAAAPADAKPAAADASDDDELED